MSQHKPIDIGAAGPEGCIHTIWLGFFAFVLMGIITSCVFTVDAKLATVQDNLHTLPDANDPMPDGWHTFTGIDGVERVTTDWLDFLSFAIIVLVTAGLGAFLFLRGD